MVAVGVPARVIRELPEDPDGGWSRIENKIAGRVLDQLGDYVGQKYRLNWWFPDPSILTSNFHTSRLQAFNPPRLSDPEIDKLIGAYERAKPSVDGLAAAIRVRSNSPRM